MKKFHAYTYLLDTLSASFLFYNVISTLKIVEKLFDILVVQSVGLIVDVFVDNIVDLVMKSSDGRLDLFLKI
jgi:hypothetical protein